MAMLFGLDCSNENCFHDTLRGYRLRFQIRRDGKCSICRKEGIELPDLVAPDKRVVTHRMQCSSCESPRPAGQPPRPLTWQKSFTRERKDMMFQRTELLVAQSQMRLLGCKQEVGPNTAHLIEDHHTLPRCYDARMIILTEEPMPRVGLYFRCQVQAGQVLTPDLVFQCDFSEGSTAAERRTAPERMLTFDQMRELTQQCVGVSEEKTYQDDGVTVAHTDIVPQMQSFTSVRCQHCHRPMPLKSFSTYSIRAVEKGD